MAPDFENKTIEILKDEKFDILKIKKIKNIRNNTRSIPLWRYLKQDENNLKINK